jgi:carbonic anhydrase
MTSAISRRRVLQGVYALAAGGAMSGLSQWAWGVPIGKGQEAHQSAISSADALKRIMAGNERYVADHANTKDHWSKDVAKVTVQHPVAAILSCADSRVTPEEVFDQGPGDLFVVRVAGNYVDTDTLTSLEYAVEDLNTPLVMVMGHTGCGAVTAVLNNAHKGEPLPGHLLMLVDALRPGVEKALAQGGGDELDNAIEENVRYHVERLKRSEPIVAEKVKAQKVQVVGAVYQLGTGKVKLL